MNYGTGKTKKRGIKKRIVWYVTIGAVLLLFTTLFFIIAQTKIFTIQTFNAYGASEINLDTIVSHLRPQVAGTFLGSLLGTNNYFAWGTNETYEDARFSGVHIKKHFWSRTIDITVIPRDRYLVWCLIRDTQLCYWVDSTGFVFDFAPSPEGQLVFTITENASTTHLSPGGYAIEPLAFDVIKKVLMGLRNLPLSIAGANVDRVLSEFRLTSLTNTVILFSLRFDPTLTAFPALEKLREGQGLSRFEYIDLTSENRALVKPR